MGLEVIESPAPIVSFQLPTSAEMQAIQRRLFDRGVNIQYSTYLGAGNRGVLRCAVFADHSFGDIDALVDLIG